MALNREAIMDALLRRLEDDVTGLRAVTRRDQDFVSIAKPAIILSIDSMERDEFGNWDIQALVNVLVEVPGNDKSPETRLNAIIDQVDDALDVHPGEAPSDGYFRTTLGGLVESVRIAGRIEMVQGIGGVGEAVIPLAITAGE
jgi:hypothetical protein